MVHGMVKIGMGAVLVGGLLAFGCSSVDAGSGESDVTETPPAPALPNDVHWMRNAAEHDAIFLQTYRAAIEKLAARVEDEGLRPGGWAVSLDIDETVLDNSTFQKERIGLAFSPEAWSAWVARREAKALPGAAAFAKEVHKLGGKVVLVTNRWGDDCPITEENLEAEGIVYDAILCAADPASTDKNPRWKSIEDGSSSGATGLAAMPIVMYVGDNIKDFPGRDQAKVKADPALLDEIGTSLFQLPNPMYGSFEKNERL